MKIGDRDNFVMTGIVELLPGVNITVNALPFGFDDMMAKELPSPIPRKRFKKGPDGRRVYIEGTKVPATEDDTDDPKFKQAEKDQTRRQGVFMIYHGTKHDPNIKWDTDITTMETPQWCDMLYKELTESGIGFAYMGSLVKAILEVSGANEQAVEAVKSGFLSGTSGIDDEPDDTFITESANDSTNGHMNSGD